MDKRYAVLILLCGIITGVISTTLGSFVFERSVSKNNEVSNVSGKLVIDVRSENRTVYSSHIIIDGGSYETFGSHEEIELSAGRHSVAIDNDLKEIEIKPNQVFNIMHYK